MATLPRTSKRTNESPLNVSQAFFSQLTRPQSEFDAGINTSVAWTEHLERGPSLSDEEPEDDIVETDDPKDRPARALYEFDGKAEFREMSGVEAGDEIYVIKDELLGGWSLVKNDTGKVGLLPRTYYTFTADFVTAPGVELPPTQSRQRDPSTTSITPRVSPTGHSQALPIIPHNTGEWHVFPSFRQSLLGGRSLNRFSSFVTSGAEEWVLNGSESASNNHTHNKFSSEDSVADEDERRMGRLEPGEADRHFVDVGPTWQTKLPPFRVLVHSPSKRTSGLSGAYTIYSVTSIFQPASPSRSVPGLDVEHESILPQFPTSITIYRRFSHFVVPHAALSRRLPGIALPPLPEKQYAGRFNDDFVEARRGDLERYIDRVVRHPVARYAEVLIFFLGCESDLEWKRQLPYHLSLPPAGPSFYAQVFHPAFNLDAEDATETVDQFDNHTRAVGKGVQVLRNIFGQVREARVGMSQAERLLLYSFLSLISCKPLSSAPLTGISGEEDEASDKAKGLINSDNAWCWREGCEDCLKLTKAMQKTSETLQSVADLFDNHARGTQLATHELLKGSAHPYSIYEPVVDMHRSALSRYIESTREGFADEEIAARCETVLNTTMAEMDTYHSQKVEDFATMTKEHLDGEINFYEQVLTKFRNARQNFDSPQYDQSGQSPRQPSRYEHELENPRLMTSPLPQPCPHIYDSAPMRPVSVAIQEGVGMLLNSTSTVRASVLGKFW